MDGASHFVTWLEFDIVPVVDIMDVVAVPAAGAEFGASVRGLMLSPEFIGAITIVCPPSRSEQGSGSGRTARTASTAVT